MIFEVDKMVSLSEKEEFEKYVKMATERYLQSAVFARIDFIGVILAFIIIFEILIILSFALLISL